MDLRDGPTRTRRACHEASSVAPVGSPLRCRTRTCTRACIPRCGGGCCGPRLLPRSTRRMRAARERRARARTRRSATTRLSLLPSRSTPHRARAHAAHAKKGEGASGTEVHAGCWALGRDVAHAAARESHARHVREGARIRRGRTRAAQHAHYPCPWRHAPRGVAEPAPRALLHPPFLHGRGAGRAPVATTPGLRTMLATATHDRAAGPPGSPSPSLLRECPLARQPKSTPIYDMGACAPLGSARDSGLGRDATAESRPLGTARWRQRRPSFVVARRRYNQQQHRPKWHLRADHPNGRRGRGASSLLFWPSDSGLATAARAAARHDATRREPTAHSAAPRGEADDRRRRWQQREPTEARVLPQ